MISSQGREWKNTVSKRLQSNWYGVPIESSFNGQSYWIHWKWSCNSSSPALHRSSHQIAVLNIQTDADKRKCSQNRKLHINTENNIENDFRRSGGWESTYTLLSFGQSPCWRCVTVWRPIISPCNFTWTFQLHHKEDYTNDVNDKAEHNERDCWSNEYVLRCWAWQCSKLYENL